LRLPERRAGRRLPRLPQQGRAALRVRLAAHRHALAPAGAHRGVSARRPARRASRRAHLPAHAFWQARRRARPRAAQPPAHRRLRELSSGRPLDAQASGFDAVVVGAGITGCEAAWRSARAGLRVLLVTTSLDTSYNLARDAERLRPPEGSLMAE